MSESIPISEDWVKNCNQLVDEVWVPTDFHVEHFVKGGVHPEKVIKIPEATDVHFYDPEITLAMDLEPKGILEV